MAKSKKASKPIKASRAVPSASKLLEVAFDTLEFEDQDLANLSALRGSGGFSRVPIVTDQAALAQFRALEAVEFGRGPGKPFADHSCYQIEIHDEIGITPLAAPILHSKRQLDRATKVAVSVGLEGTAKLTQRIALDYPSAGNESIVQSTRLIGFASSDIDAEMLSAGLVSNAKAAGLGNLKIAVVAVADDGLDAALQWQHADPARGVKLFVDDNGTRRWRPTRDVLDPALILRRFEVASQSRLNEIVVGFGSRGSVAIRTVRTRLAAWQKGRVEVGLILSEGFDAWAFWATLWPKIGMSGYLPYRTDIPPRIPSLGKPRRRRKGALVPKAVRTKSKKRYRGLAKPDEA